MTVSVVAFIFLVVFFLVLVLIWGILLFVYVREKSITPAKEFFLKTFMSTLSIIGAILAATVATSVQINKLMVDFNATFNADQSQTTNVSVIGNLGDISPEDKLIRMVILKVLRSETITMDMHMQMDCTLSQTLKLRNCISIKRLLWSLNRDTPINFEQ